MGAFFLQETRRDRLTVRASGMAFTFLLACFPLLLFFFSAIPYIPIPNFDEAALDFLSSFIPGDFVRAVDGPIRNILEERRFGALSAGFFGAFFFGTNGVNSMIAAFDKQHPGYLKRSFWRLRGAAIRLTVYILILFCGSLLLIVGGGELAKEISFDRDTITNLLLVFRWLVIVGLYFTTISLIYYYGPSKKQKWKFVTPGSTLATMMSIAATVGFSIFLNRFDPYHTHFGPMGTLLVFMIWLNINTFVLLVGFELNNSIEMNRLRLEGENPEEIMD